MKEMVRTGFASVDRPWEQFYDGIEQKEDFLDTTPYTGLVKSNESFPDETAIEYFGAKITFGELLRNIDGVAKSLEAYGIKEGDFVTICSTTTPEVIYLFYAISKIGAIANIMAPFFSPEELLHNINECESKLIIMVDKFVPLFREVFAKDNSKKVVILPLMNSSLLRFFSRSIGTKESNEISWKQFLKSGQARNEAQTRPYKRFMPMAMVYSSGTTGATKGILLSVDSFQRLVNAYGSSGFDTSRRQTVFQNIPPWHSTGLSLGINFPLSFGVKVCTDPRFDHEVFIKNVLRYKPEYILTNTTMYQGLTLEKCQKRLKGKSLSFLKYPVEGGEPLTEKDIKRIESVFKKHGSSARLLNGYGECECGATVTTDITSHKFSDSASGIPLPNITTIGVFDDSYNELKYGQRGNILVRTEIGMLEYYKKPNDTKEFFHIDENGEKWSKTGDVGYINEDGSLVVLGRKSDHVIINGRRMYLFDIERAILKSDRVKLCEVQPHPQKESSLVAHIVWENDVQARMKQDKGLLDKYLREFQDLVLQTLNEIEAVPKYYRIWESFPSAYSGKRDLNLIRNSTDSLIENSWYPLY